MATDPPRIRPSMSDAPPDIRLRLLEAGLGEVQAAVRVRPISWGKIIPILLTVVLTGGTIIWRLAQYPSRDEFDRAGAASAARLEELQRQAGALERELIRVRASLDASSAQQRDLAERVDALIRFPSPRRGK